MKKLLIVLFLTGTFAACRSTKTIIANPAASQQPTDTILQGDKLKNEPNKQ